MSTRKNTLTALAAEVQAKSAAFAQRMRDSMPSMLVDVGHYSTDAFLMRSFVSLRSDNQGDELALTVNIATPPVNAANSMISIESDLCLDNGTIVTMGPCAKLDPSSPGFGKALSEWTTDFYAFLADSEIEARNILKEISLKQSRLSDTSKF